MPNIDDPFLDDLEPSAAQEGIDVPGSRSAFTDFINFGVYNGNFRVGPPQSLSNLDVATSTSGSNFLPGWRFVQSSNTTITAKIVQSGGVGSGSNVRFTAQAGIASGHASYLEQIIDIGGSSVGDIGNLVRLAMRKNVLGPGLGLGLTVAAQYLAADGTTVGMPAEVTSSLAPSTSPTGGDVAMEADAPPANARYLRLRSIVDGRAGTVANDWLDILEIRRDRALPNLRMPDLSRSTNGLYDVRMSGSNLLWQPSSTTAGTTTTKRLLNYQLVPLVFTGVNIPANATTNLDMPGDATLNLATPRIGLPWASSIVGMSYRLSAIPTAGGTGALKLIVQVGGSNLWNPAFSINGSGGALSNETSVAPETYNVASGGQIGVVATTTATYAPTTAEIVVVVWLAVKYDGA